MCVSPSYTIPGPLASMVNSVRKTTIFCIHFLEDTYDQAEVELLKQEYTRESTERQMKIPWRAFTQYLIQVAEIRPIKRMPRSAIIKHLNGFMTWLTKLNVNERKTGQKRQRRPGRIQKRGNQELAESTFRSYVTLVLRRIGQTNPILVVLINVLWAATQLAASLKQY